MDKEKELYVCVNALQKCKILCVFSPFLWIDLLFLWIDLHSCGFLSYSCGIHWNRPISAGICGAPKSTVPFFLAIHSPAGCAHIVLLQFTWEGAVTREVSGFATIKALVTSRCQCLPLWG